MRANFTVSVITVFPLGLRVGFSLHMEILADASQGPREAEGNTKNSTLARGHALLARHRTGVLFSFIFTLCCFNGSKSV